MKLAILHQLPVELYPPTTNAVDFFSSRDATETMLITSENRKGRTAYENSKVTLRRYPFANPRDRLLKRWFTAFRWYWRAAKELASFDPDVMLYYEPHSALAAYLYYRWFGGTARLFIHHHEYYTPEDYRAPGNRLTRINHWCEKKYLFPKASWISQTNADRLRFFKQDQPRITLNSFHVMPNFPPRSWLQSCESVTRKTTDSEPLRMVYVGSVSLVDTYIRNLVDWVLRLPNDAASLDVFAYNNDVDTRAYLNEASGNRIRFHAHGVDYDELPKLLPKFDVGLILYKCNTVNFQYNASNKLFEYLACGLDVWYPPAMLGVKPHARKDAYPRVIEVDYEDMDSVDLAALRSRACLPHQPSTTSCEAVLEELEREMRDGRSE